MKQYTPEIEETPALLEEVWKLLDSSASSFGQERVFRRAVAMLFGELFALGRHVTTQILRALGVADRDWSGWYRLYSRPRFREGELGSLLAGETARHVPIDEPYVTVIDGVRTYRSGKKVAGSSLWPAQNTVPFDRGFARAQRFVEISWLTPVEESYCRAVPLRWFPAPTPKAVPSDVPPCKEWEAGLQALYWIRNELDQQGRSEQWLVASADGSYDVQGIWEPLPPRTVLVVRCARNRALYALPQPVVDPHKPGPKPKYGERLPPPPHWIRKRRELQTLVLPIRGKDRHLPCRVVGPVLVEGAPGRPLFLIAVGGRTKRTKRKTYYRKPAYYLVNAVQQEDGTWQLPYPVEMLLTWAWHRWECEVAHREMKSGLGVGEKQSWGPRSAWSAVQWGVWVYAVCVLAAYRTWGISGGPRRQGKWYRNARRWSLSAMWQGYRAALWEVAELRPLYLPTLDKWLKKEIWMTGLGNALADPSRL